MSIDTRLQLRSNFQQSRRAVTDPVERSADIVRQLIAFLPDAEIIAAYMATNGEVSLDALFAQKPAQSWGLPRTHTERTMTFHRWRLGDPLEHGDYGILTPAADAVEVTPSLVLVPLVAFDTSGTRLGMGGGYYDKYLATLNQTVPKVGIAYDCQRSMTPLPQEDWDVRLSAVVTETGVIEFKP